ncbi:MAG TPA: carbonate dehydratase [Pseudomonadales bacterium]|nr:carbonate dehydratase [Pseudomonadales bacterium]
MPLRDLFVNNATWAAEMTREDPAFFSALADQQSPRFLWIGCADSRVPANEIVGLRPGELFVHRNVANVVVHSDLNFLSVLQYAVEVLQVEHIMVTGHYGCGGVRASMRSEQYGLIDNWLRHIRDVYYRHQAELDDIDDEDRRVDRMCELNVVAQMSNVCHTSIVQAAWARGQKLWVHGLIYSIRDGLLHTVCSSINSVDKMPRPYRVTR